ncbi:MAG: hypothetical protein OEY78_01355 [Gammaproteobacteria bacterium]|nr:hypothetical protein [Gammaproteobacteria bacterium]
MNSLVLKLVIIGCLLFQYGCSLKFKRKSVPVSEKPAEMIQYEKRSEKHVDVKNSVNLTDKFSEKDHQLISSYYTDKANQIIRQDMIAHTQVSAKQEDNLVINEFIPGDIQAMPLPLMLERKLSSLPLHLIRVHVGKQVIIMNVKSRQILDIIKI